MKKPPLKNGERVVVTGMTKSVVTVKLSTWIYHEARWKIDLDWGEFGSSVIYDTDEGKTWYRYSTSN